MEKQGMSQEGLKLIACVSMLLDHIGAVFFTGIGLRVIGRIAFPIYCFLLAEGVHYTQNPKKYGMRLALGALLSEIPFDLLFFGELTLAHSSVMVTLLLSFLYAMAAKRVEAPYQKCLLVLPFAVCAELLGTDYGGWGVVLAALFMLTRGQKQAKVIQILGMAVICWMIGGYTVRLGTVAFPIEMAALAALGPIFCYHGRKASRSAGIQWAFYLFYPVHLTILFVVYLAMLFAAL